MNSGRDLDEIVGEKVMGWLPPTMNAFAQSSPLPHYSTEMADAWKVKEKANIYEIVNAGKVVLAYYGKPELRLFAEGTSEPHSICLAALKAVGHELP